MGIILDLYLSFDHFNLIIIGKANFTLNLKFNIKGGFFNVEIAYDVCYILAEVDKMICEFANPVIDIVAVEKMQ
jgi:hypothetical protein